MGILTLRRRSAAARPEAAVAGGTRQTMKGLAESSSAFEASIPKATGEMIAVNQDTGKIE
jgi:Cu/Ag efflux protein CusF